MVPKNKLQTESSSGIVKSIGRLTESSRIAALHATVLFIFAILIPLSARWPAACAKASNVLPLNYDFLFGDDCSHLAHFNSPGSARNSQIRVQSPRMCPLPACEWKIRNKQIGSCALCAPSRDLQLG